MSDTTLGGEGEDVTLTPLTDKERRETDWCLLDKSWLPDRRETEAQGTCLLQKEKREGASG